MQTVVWCFLADAKSLHASTLIQSIGKFVSWFSAVKCWPFCTIIVLHYPICEGDYTEYESGLVEHVSVVTVYMRECL